jgi:hypothetical protein
MSAPSAKFYVVAAMKKLEATLDALDQSAPDELKGTC